MAAKRKQARNSAGRRNLIKMKKKELKLVPYKNNQLNSQLVRGVHFEKIGPNDLINLNTDVDKQKGPELWHVQSVDFINKSVEARQVFADRLGPVRKISFKRIARVINHDRDDIKRDNPSKRIRAIWTMREDAEQLDAFEENEEIEEKESYQPVSDENFKKFMNRSMTSLLAQIPMSMFIDNYIANQNQEVQYLAEEFEAVNIDPVAEPFELVQLEEALLEIPVGDIADEEEDQLQQQQHLQQQQPQQHLQQPQHQHQLHQQPQPEPPHIAARREDVQRRNAWRAVREPATLAQPYLQLRPTQRRNYRESDDSE